MKRALLCVLLPLLLLGCTASTEEAPAPSPAPTADAASKPQEIELVLATAEPTAVSTPIPTPPLMGITIGIDPGHQYIYNREQEPVAPNETETKVKVAVGTRGIVSRVYEYQVVLDVGMKLKTLLEEAGATVVMTRTTNDVDISNKERAELFNEHQVDLALRLHCNGSDDESIRGAFMLIPSEHRTEHYETNDRAARIILSHYLEETGLPMRYRDGITVRSNQTGFNWCTQPIVCIELGHMSNEEEDLLLTNTTFQGKMAVGLFEGILAFFTEDVSATADPTLVP